MSISLCIHGHFYQPPREDPWLGRILAEPSAAPMPDWNQRILRESYAPLAWARRMDDAGRIADILNCYEWISFNAGPTLLHWMRQEAPETLARMREGDAASRARWGYGNALAQIYHHVIMPLASARDKILETRWAIADFRHHFQRDPEGMWLSECAVDTPTLEVLAGEGISFVILSPGQARAVVRDGVTVPVTPETLRIGEPYRAALPGGKAMTVIFYHGELSQRIAFDGLLRDGEVFWQRIVQAARVLEAQTGAAPAPGTQTGATSKILTLATDGETYGHHFTFGEMALAYALAQGYGRRDNIALTNLAAFTAAHPPTAEVLLHEPSSWSCAHGVERWKNDCGCKDGGHPDWNQQWRAPLRKALEYARAGVEAHFSQNGPQCFLNAEAALSALGEVLADPDRRDAFATAHIRAGHEDAAWKLLAMQEQSLASFASCAWFFDDIARIEPENALCFALRSLELMEGAGADLLPGMEEILAEAHSNKMEAGSGKDIFLREVLPRRASPASLCMLTLALLNARSLPRPSWNAGDAELQIIWPRVTVRILPDISGQPGHWQGSAVITSCLEKQELLLTWRWLAPDIPGLPGIPDFSCGEIRARLADGGESHAAMRELSKPMRGYLLAEILTMGTRKLSPRLRKKSERMLALLDAPDEAEHDLCMPEFWNDALPYLACEATRRPLGDDICAKLQGILSRHLGPAARRLAQRLIREDMLETLGDLNRQAAPPQGADSGRTAPPDDADAGMTALPDIVDARLAAQADRACRLLPDMDWWAVQNAVWQAGRRLPLTAERLGFGV